MINTRVRTPIKSIIYIILLIVNIFASLFVFISMVGTCEIFLGLYCTKEQIVNNFWGGLDVISFFTTVWLIDTILISLIFILYLNNLRIKPIYLNNLRIKTIIRPMKIYESAVYILPISFVFVFIGLTYSSIPSITHETNYATKLDVAIPEVAYLVNTELEKGNNIFVKENFMDKSFEYENMEFSVKKMGKRGYEFYHFNEQNFDIFGSNALEPNYMNSENSYDPNMGTIEYTFPSSYHDDDELNESSSFPVLEEKSYVLYDIPTEVTSIDNFNSLRFNADFAAEKYVKKSNVGYKDTYPNEPIYFCIKMELVYDLKDVYAERKECFNSSVDENSILAKNDIEFEKDFSSVKSREIFSNMGSLIKPNTKLKVSIFKQIDTPFDKDEIVFWTIYNEKLSVTNDLRNENTNRFCLESRHKANQNLYAHMIFSNEYKNDMASNKLKYGKCPISY